MQASSFRSIFRNSALLSKLVTVEQIQRAEETLRAGGETAAQIDDEALAEQLVAEGVLTTYQAEQLKNGRTKLTLGPYHITDWIGQGGMGQVFKAVHEVMGRECAIKVLPLNKKTEHAVSTFRKEIRTQAQLDHTNLVRAYDAGEDGNVHYLVLEYVPGTDLRRLVRNEKRLSMQQAARIIRQAALALEYAHQRGFIHRDVKPGNILVTPAGVAKLSDLGLAGVMQAAEDPATSGKVVGTADYLAPEQIRQSGQITAASDIYSLGCTLYYAITGKVPYPGGTPQNKAMRHCEETPWHPRRFNPEISEEFVEVVADMMEKDPAARVPSAAEVAARLEMWVDDENPLPSRRMGKSPWMPPPLPVIPDLDFEDLHETGSAGYEMSEAASGSSIPPVQPSSQSTLRLGGQDTSHGEPPRLLSLHARIHPAAYVAITLALAVPLSVLLGFIVGFLLAWQLI